MAKTANTQEQTEIDNLSDQIDLLFEQYDDKNIVNRLFELGSIFYAQEKHLPESLDEFVRQNYDDATQYTIFYLD